MVRSRAPLAQSVRSVKPRGSLFDLRARHPYPWDPCPAHLTVIEASTMMPSMKKPAAKSPAPTNLDNLKYRTVGSFLWAIFDFQLQRLESPLPWLTRFVIALSGSLSLFSVSQDQAGVVRGEMT